MLEAIISRDSMEEWLKLDLSQLKRLVKSRAGRIAELQMEIKIIEGIIESKIREGDLGYSKPEKPEKPKKEKESEPKEEKKELKKDIKPSSNHSFEEME
jgi:hypothetical protein